MTEKILFRVPGELKGFLRKESKKRGATLNQLGLQILWEWAEAHGLITDKVDYLRSLKTE